jgi:hypothetical protein
MVSHHSQCCNTCSFLSIAAGISQREVNECFQSLLDAGLQSELRARILKFYQQSIRGRFLLPNFTFDCYVPISSKAAVKLIDFNPLGGTTSPLLFTWEELLPTQQAPHADAVNEDVRVWGGTDPGHQQQEQGGGTDPGHQQQEQGGGGKTSRQQQGWDGSSGQVELKIVDKEPPMRPTKALYGLPFDFVDSSEGAPMEALLREMQQQQQQQQQQQEKQEEIALQ